MSEQTSNTDKVAIKDVPCFKNYSVDTNGTVYSNRNGIKLKPHVNRYGYPCVTIANEHGRKNTPVHRLVALTFIPNPSRYEQVNHKDENKLNNSVSNLEWCDNKYNLTYGSVISRRSKTQSKGLVATELSTGISIEFSSVRKAEKEIGIPRGSISDVCNRKRTSTGGYKFIYAHEPKGDHHD